MLQQQKSYTTSDIQRQSDSGSGSVAVAVCHIDFFQATRTCSDMSGAICRDAGIVKVCYARPRVADRDAENAEISRW